jgi:4'-phosphopantetheinyl transferase
VHVWRADLETVGDELEQLLCADERARSARFPRTGAARLWMRSRGVLRALLGRYLGTDARTLRFASGAQGKPQLLGASALSFSLSHSGSLALYAVTDIGAVGIDVEIGRRSLDVLAVATRAFGASQAERLAEIEPSLREREFLRLWTRHEAALKCRGTGIGGTGIGVTPAVASPEPWIAELEIGQRAAAAVARQTPPRALNAWEWR